MYRTKDFYLSCVLLSNEIEFIGSEKKDGANTVFFKFNLSDNENKINTIVNDFVNQECFVNVKKFTWAMKKMRRELEKWRI